MPLTDWEDFSTNPNQPVARARGSGGEVVEVNYFLVSDFLIGPTGPNLGEKEIRARLRSYSEPIRRRAGSKYDRGEFTHVAGDRGEYLCIELTNADTRWVLAQVRDDEQEVSPVNVPTDPNS